MYTVKTNSYCLFFAIFNFIYSKLAWSGKGIFLFYMYIIVVLCMILNISGCKLALYIARARKRNVYTVEPGWTVTLHKRSPRLSGHFVTLPAISFLFYNLIKRSPPIFGQQKCLPIVVFWPHKRPVFSYLLSNQRCQMTLCRSFLLDYCVCAYWQSINNVMSLMTVNNCQLRLGEQGRGKGIKGS